MAIDERELFRGLYGLDEEYDLIGESIVVVFVCQLHIARLKTILHIFWQSSVFPTHGRTREGAELLLFQTNTGANH